MSQISLSITRGYCRGNESSLVRPIDEVSTLSLEHDENDIGFSYSILDYRAPEIDKYYTMLEGYDDIWRQLSVRKLSALTYKFLWALMYSG